MTVTDKKRAASAILSAALACALCALPAPALASDASCSWQGGQTGFATGEADLMEGVGDIVPGDSASGTVTVRNDGTRPTEFLLDALEGRTPSREGAEKLLDEVSFRVSVGGRVVCDAPLGSNDLLDGGVSLGTVEPGGSVTCDWELSLPEGAGNGLALAADSVRLALTAKEEPPAPVMPQLGVGPVMVAGAVALASGTVAVTATARRGCDR